MTTSFTETIRQESSAIWDAQMTHPFVMALADGTLPQETFQFYILQDARFLIDLAKTFAFAATKTDDRDRILKFGEFLLDTVRVERALHEMYAARFGLTLAQMAATPMAPTNYAYTRHMLQVAAMGSLAEVVTVMLPCAWIYADIGEHLPHWGSRPRATHIATGWRHTRTRTSRPWASGCVPSSMTRPLEWTIAAASGSATSSAQAASTSGSSGRWLGHAKHGLSEE